MPIPAAAGIGRVAAGIATGGFGAWAKANAAKLAQKRMREAFNLPGVDIGGVTQESLSNILGNMDTASDISRRSTFANQAVLTDLLNQTIPGYSGMQQQRSDVTRSMLAGELPPDVVAAINRRSAGRALSGGYSGSGFHDALTARDLGLTSLDLINRGMGYSERLASTTPRANVIGTENFFGPVPNQLLDVRSREREAKQKLMAQYSGMPGGTSVWGDWMTGLGGTLTGLGSSFLGKPPVATAAS